MPYVNKTDDTRSGPRRISAVSSSAPSFCWLQVVLRPGKAVDSGVATHLRSLRPRQAERRSARL